MAPRKILLLINTLRTGGTERNVASICQHIDRSRFEPEVWVLHGGGEWEARVRDAGIKVRNLDRRWARSPLFALRTAREIAKADVDLVHAFLPTSGFYAALARTACGLRKPLIVSVGQSTTITRSERLLWRWFSRCYDRAIANSVSVQNMLCGLGFENSQVRVIPNGHDYRPYCLPFDREETRRKLGVGPQEILLITVGRLVDTKRIGDAVEALAAIRLRGYPAKFVIVGDGPERAALEQQVQTLSLTEAVTFTGNRSNVIDLLRSADLFLFPSELEGLPNALIEACLARLPIVACDVPGVADILRDGEHAFLVPPRQSQLLADAVSACLRQPEMGASLAARAREHALCNYSVEACLPRLYEVYDELLGRPAFHRYRDAMLQSCQS